MSRKPPVVPDYEKLLHGSVAERQEAIILALLAAWEDGWSQCMETTMEAFRDFQLQLAQPVGPDSKEIVQ